MKLERRRRRFPADKHPGGGHYRALRSFHKPQRAHVKHPMPAPKS